MRRALALARRGWGQTSPNPLVGAVIVKEGRIVGEGWHERFGADHAEVEALRAAGDEARGATIYVTLEPCAHHGKTPPCTDALLRAGVRRVVAAVRDPSEPARGGLEYLNGRGVAVESGILAAAACELNAPFFHALRSARPWVTLKLALSLDGAMADATGRSRWITGPRARREVHRLRAGSDAIAIGIGTALADDPRLTVRGVPAPRLPPRRVIFDRQARLPLDGALARTARKIPTIVICDTIESERAGALERAGVDIVPARSLAEAMEALRSRGVQSLLVEGGATLASALMAASLVDRLIIFRAPVLLGGGAHSPFASLPSSPAADATRLVMMRQRTLGDDVMTTYALQVLPCSPD
ncbi:MAG: bifunctional diaminohydroxyphosphoribosylaminopyrimidine deaminase/5-amino-6-(5-phosphoribosylamino)uracil reductase RibD [Gemmatimonadota bacterium]|nr:bifunctional diaminohydroxyphosphoribosylaminopyrimidine deaminase/5-amino-6-(5-phosphoribosylamino)uracil reductase RibD [Gemmatimonadota bacterium]